MAELGWGTIIYLARWPGSTPNSTRRPVWTVRHDCSASATSTLPGILPTIAILFILAVGNLMAVGFEKIYLMQNPLNLERPRFIQTYVYKSGTAPSPVQLLGAVGLFNNLINLVLSLCSSTAPRGALRCGLW